MSFFLLDSSSSGVTFFPKGTQLHFGTDISLPVRLGGSRRAVAESMENFSNLLRSRSQTS